MSISDERPTNPSKLFLKVKSGKIVYWDKESQENIAIPEPFEFIVLDQLATIKGWSDADESGYWSNEVRRVGTDDLTVRTSRGVKEVGIWRDIKGSSALGGAKYTASVYIAHKFNGKFVISNLALSGAALNAWIEFTQKTRINSVKVVLNEWADAKKGAVSYKTPVFEGTELSDVEKDEAIALDKELQAYFKEYFNTHQQESLVGTTKLDKVNYDFKDDEPIDLSEIPF